MTAPASARFVTWSSMRWVIRHRAWTPWYLVRYWRFGCWRLRHRHVICEGMVFLGRHSRIEARKGYSRLVVGRWVHVGDGSRLIAHEGSLRVGDKTVFGTDVTVTAYLDIEVGASCLVADDVYVTDFDHAFDDITAPVKDQGIVKSPVRIGPDCWLGTKSVVTRGVLIGRGCVVGAGSVVTKPLPAMSVAVGNPARVIKDRREQYVDDEPRRAALLDIRRKTAAAAQESASLDRSAEQSQRRAPEVQEGLVEPGE